MTQHNNSLNQKITNTQHTTVTMWTIKRDNYNNNSSNTIQININRDH